MSMPTRTATATWRGTLKRGAGRLRLGSRAFEGSYTFVSRLESSPGTNLEELIGTAHANCSSMFLAALLTETGFLPKSLRTTAAKENCALSKALAGPEFRLTARLAR